jgi:GH43 family beta-xylosidase
MGPYCHVNDRARVLQSIPGRLIGPGHNSVVSGPDGRDYIVYHAWDESHTARKMHISPLAWDADGPRAVVD